MVATCDEEGRMLLWEWDVDPKTRIPHIPQEHVDEIQDFVDTHYIVMHNAKFDVAALESIGVKINWDFIDDTLTASHIYRSDISHGLKPLCNGLLDIPEDDEADLHKATNQARAFGRNKQRQWRIAEPGDPMFPGWKPNGEDGKWKLDMWLPRAVWMVDRSRKGWNKLCSRYCLRDAERTMALWNELKDWLIKTDNVRLYQVRRENLIHTYDMENIGVTLDPERLEEKIEEVQGLVDTLETQCLMLCDYTIDNLNSRQQLQGLLFGTWGLTPTPTTKSGGYSTKAEHLLPIEQSLHIRSKQRGFLARYRMRSKYATGLRFLNSYKAFGVEGDSKITIYPHILTTGTRTTRYSSKQPNSQNVSKQEEFNLRYVFGPAPGRIWYSIDYANIELRILAYASNETELIKAFKSGDSVHMNFAWIVCPELIEAAGGPAEFKKTNQYRWVKNGDFALTYGASRRTADATYHINGAYDKIRGYFTNLKEFMDGRIAVARRDGYITTLGDYKLHTPRGKEYTTAVDYFCQGTAGWAMCMAVNRVGRYLKQQPGYHQIMTIHDELVIDAPAEENNDAVINHVMTLMEQSGDDIGIPTPVECDVHHHNWADDVPFIAS